MAGNFKSQRELFLHLYLGWSFAIPLMSILLAHEFGHYFAAKIHGVHASLPYFLPMPFSPFGTWGAIIAMPNRIASRRALLDIGAAGPLAGMVIAVPVLIIGLKLSAVTRTPEHAFMEGQSLFYLGLKALLFPPIPAGYDVELHPTAFAGWAGLFVTMINLIPFGQLDGGHIAYSLFEEKQNRIAPWIRWGLIPLFLIAVARNLFHAHRSGMPQGSVGMIISNSAFWLFWFIMLSVMSRMGGGVNHPPTDPGETLGPRRRAVAIGCMVLFVLLFMPAPLTVSLGFNLFN
jgi:membrane-associated protease RseP (regulator of RpoE activity)